MSVHAQHLLLGVGGPLLLLALLAWHLSDTLPARASALVAWLRGVAADARAIDLDAPTLPDLAAVEHVGAQDDTATTQWIDCLWRDDDRDDAVPVDMAALMAEQDIEEGREFVRWVEERVALETAVSFGFIRLEGVGVR